MGSRKRLAAASPLYFPLETTLDACSAVYFNLTGKLFGRGIESRMECREGLSRVWYFNVFIVCRYVCILKAHLFIIYK